MPVKLRAQLECMRATCAGDIATAEVRALLATRAIHGAARGPNACRWHSPHMLTRHSLKERLQQRVRGQQAAALASFQARRAALRRQHEEQEAIAAAEQRTLQQRYAEELAAHHQLLQTQARCPFPGYVARVPIVLVGWYSCRLEKLQSCDA